MREMAPVANPRVPAALVAAMATLTLIVMIMFPASASAAETGDAQTQGFSQTQALSAGQAISSQSDKLRIIPRVLWLGMGDARISASGAVKRATILEVKSSKPSVMSVSGEDGGDIESVTLTPNKPGKSTLTVKYKLGSATKVVNAVYQVMRFPNPVKSIKVNGVGVIVPTSKNCKKETALCDFADTKVKFKVGLIPGWKVGSISVYEYTRGSDFGKTYYVSPGASFKLPKGKNARVTIEVVGKGQARYRYAVNLMRRVPMEIGKGTVYLGSTRMLRYTDYAASASDDIRVVRITSKNKKVLGVAKAGPMLDQCTLIPKKPGKSKVTLTYKYEGKRYTTSAIYRVKSVPNALKAAYVNGKAINLKANKNGYFDKKYAKDEVAVSVVANDGWSLKSMWYYTDGGDATSIEDGESLKVPKDGAAYVAVDFGNANGETVSYEFVFFRK